jgi:hypothetical protein
MGAQVALCVYIMHCKLLLGLSRQDIDIQIADYSGLEGATGYTPPPQDVPAWEDPREEEHEDELHEVRRRRLQHFSHDGSQTEKGANDNIDLD